MGFCQRDEANGIAGRNETSYSKVRDSDEGATQGPGVASERFPPSIPVFLGLFFAHWGPTRGVLCS